MHYLSVELERKKELKFLIEAWKHIDYPLTIAGSGHEDQLKSLNHKNINFIGNQDEKNY